MKTADDVLHFWFTAHSHEDWFGGKAEFDDVLRAEFGNTHPHVAAGEAWAWRQTPQGRLAEIIVLDQFSRQLHRGEARAFASDPMALALAQEFVASGRHNELAPQQLMFVLLPYMHSESLLIHASAAPLFTALGSPEQIDFEERHVEVLRRFGRYPRRNAALGRVSTPEELAYIASGDAMF